MVSLNLNFLLTICTVSFCYISVFSTTSSGFDQPVSQTKQDFTVGSYCTATMWMLCIACFFYCVPKIAPLSYSLHPLGNPVIASGFRDTIKETPHIKQVVTSWVVNLQSHLYIMCTIKIMQYYRWLDRLTIFTHVGNKPAHDNGCGCLP